jgi:hypothetical protein
MMRCFNTTAVLTLLVVALTADDKKPLLTLSKDDVGKLPAGWKAAQTGKGEGSVWKVTADDTAPSKSGFVLAQTAEGPDALFNLCVAEGSEYQDVEISVAFKAVKGKSDQGGANNYYLCRMNPLEDNFRVYKVVSGKRTQLQSAPVKVAPGEWHSIQVVQKGEQIECSVDGKKRLEVKDDVFTQSGKVGLWTKSDARTYFDDLQVSGK